MGLTIRDVARAAGVSKAAVSYVLNGRPGVSEDTRRRVLAIVNELGYRPNSVARSLAGKRTQTLGLVIPHISDMFYATIVRGVESEAAAHGYTLMLQTTQADPRRERQVVDAITSGRVDGAILMTYHLKPSLFEALAGRGQVFVLLDDPGASPGLYSVNVDNVQAGRLATEYLLRLGHRRIAFIHGSPRSRDTWLRFEGYRRALEAYGTPVVDDYVRTGEFRREGGAEATHSLMALSRPPTAILAANDHMAIGALEALGQLGLEVPGDVSVIGVDDIEAASVVRPPLTTVRQPTFEMGRLAVDLLLRLIAGESPEPRHVVLPVELVVRSSCGPLQTAENGRSGCKG